MPLLPVGSGSQRSVSYASPAAGAFFAGAVPDRGRYRIISVQFRYVCSVAVATRQPYVYFTWSGAGEVRGDPKLGLVALDDYFFYGAADYPVEPSTLATSRLFAIPGQLSLPQSSTFNVGAINIQAADQISGVILGVEEWLEP